MDLSRFLVSYVFIFVFIVFDYIVIQERNSLGGSKFHLSTLSELTLVLSAAVKAVTAAQLSMASHGIYRVTLDEAIEAMRLTAADMSVKYKETSLSVRLPSVCFNISIHVRNLTGSRRKYK